MYVSETHAKTLNKIEFRKHVTKKISGAFQPWSPTGRKSHISVSTFVAVKGPLKLKCLPVCPFSPYVLLKKTGASRSKRRHYFIHLQAGTRELHILHASAAEKHPLHTYFLNKFSFISTISGGLQTIQEFQPSDSLYCDLASDSA